MVIVLICSFFTMDLIEYSQKRLARSWESIPCGADLADVSTFCWEEMTTNLNLSLWSYYGPNSKIVGWKAANTIPHSIGENSFQPREMNIHKVISPEGESRTVNKRKHSLGGAGILKGHAVKTEGHSAFLKKINVNNKENPFCTSTRWTSAEIQLIVLYFKSMERLSVAQHKRKT